MGDQWQVVLQPRKGCGRASLLLRALRDLTERGYPYHLLIVNSTISDSKWNDAKFCLAPAGDGWGIRMGKSAVLNCLPLIAQPYVMQAFEDVLPYENFSRRIAFEQVPQLLSILRSVKAPQVADMRAVLEKMKPA